MFTPEELLHKAIDTIEALNFTDFFGRVLSEGDNNYTSVMVATAILNMTNHIYWNGTTPFEAPHLA